MASKKSNKKSSDSTKKLEISAKAIIDNMVFSKTDKWAYYRVSNKVYDFLSSSGKVNLGLKITSALNNLMSERQEPLECHMIITSVPIDIDSWAGQVHEIAGTWGTPDGFNKYVEDQIQYLKREEFHRKITYIGINMGKRGALETENINVLEAGFKGAAESLKKIVANSLKIPTEEINAEEEALSRSSEADIFRVLSTGNLEAKRCTSEEILLLIKRQFYPNMKAPYLDIDHDTRIGPGDIALELHSAISKKYRWLKFTQMIEGEEIEGYRACMSFSKFPKFQDFPNSGFPFFYFPSKMGLPFTCYARFELHPVSKIKKELGKKEQEHEDEIDNLQGAEKGYPSEVIDSLQDLQTISDIVAKDKSPWVHGHYRIVVETPNEELLKKYCTIVKQKYSDLDININWTAGNQASLFLEQMPGDKIRFDAFKQISNLTSLSTSGFNFSSDIGDPIYGNDGEVDL